VRVVENVNTVLAIELLAACVAMDYRSLPGSPLEEAVRTVVRKLVPPLQWDRMLHLDIEAMKRLLREGEINRLLQSYLPKLGNRP